MIYNPPIQVLTAEKILQKGTINLITAPTRESKNYRQTNHNIFHDILGTYANLNIAEV